MSETRAISTTPRSKLLSSFFFLQGKALMEIQAILTETACFLPGRAKDLSATLYIIYKMQFLVEMFYLALYFTHPHQFSGNWV